MLSSYLNQAESQTVIKHWRDNYSGQTNFVLGVDGFINEVCELYNLTAYKPKILHQITQKLHAVKVNDVILHNESKRSVLKMGQDQHKTNDNPLLACCQLLIDELNTFVTPEHQAAYIQTLVVDMHKIKKLSYHQKRTITHWLTMGNSLANESCNNTLTRKQLANMVSSAYSNLCYYIGPVKADEAILQGVAKAKQQFDEKLVEQLL